MEARGPKSKVKKYVSFSPTWPCLISHMSIFICCCHFLIQPQDWLDYEPFYQILAWVKNRWPTIQTTALKIYGKGTCPFILWHIFLHRFFPLSMEFLHHRPRLTVWAKNPKDLINSNSVSANSLCFIFDETDCGALHNNAIKESKSADKGERYFSIGWMMTIILIWLYRKED